MFIEQPFSYRLNIVQEIKDLLLTFSGLQGLTSQTIGLLFACNILATP
jgi:hypothetical protein